MKLYFNHTAPLDPVPVCSLILTPTRSSYGGRLVVNSQYRLTVNTPLLRDAVAAIFRIEQLGPSLYGTKTKTEMNNYSAIYSFCGFHPPHTNKNNSDFIFVGPRLITYLQQKWISFLLTFLVNKNENGQ